MLPESLTIAELLAPVLIVVGAGFVFLVMMLIAVAQWIKVAKARRWPVVRGTVLESKILDSRDSDGGWDYRPIITYQYLVGQQVYTNNVLAFGSRSYSEGGVSGEKKAHRTVARYPVGSSVEVYYHPERPAESVLEVRSAVTKFLLIFGSGFFLVGIFVGAVVLIVNVVSH